MARLRVRVREAEILRAFRVAEKAGVRIERLDIDPSNGTISIFPAVKGHPKTGEVKDTHAKLT